MIYKTLAALIITAFLAMFAHGNGVYAAPIVIDPSDGIDAVLVIDTSGSMRTADPERIALEAASLFLGMMETRNSRIGIVNFAGVIDWELPLTSISDPTFRQQVRTNISRFTYHGNTDIGLALRRAAEMVLYDPIPGNSPMILLFTDGNIHLPAHWHRSMEESYLDVEWAVDAMVGIAPIYTIGLNYDGTLNTDFLADISHQTGAAGHIVYDAGELPQLFNEIFASHIRSSIIEIEDFVAPADGYTDVIVPIPSAFVSEANIIMLSTQPIASVRLFDPSGREVTFDGDAYTLSSARRYSMIKILEPIRGDWLLQVQGVPQDRITVNLIYNYSVDVSWSLTQPDSPVPYFDPTRHITMQVGFISPLPASQIAALFYDSRADLSVYNMDMEHLHTEPMVNTGNAFVLDFLFDPPQDVRLSVTVSHPYFTQQTVFTTINFDPDILAGMPPPVAPQPPPPTPEPAPAPPPPQPAPPPPLEVEITPTEPVEEEPRQPIDPLIFVLIGAALALIIAAFLLRAIVKRRNLSRVFTGHLEVRALLADGNYTSLEAPDLGLYVGQVALTEFLSNSIGRKAERIMDSGIPIWGVTMSPAYSGRRPCIALVNGSKPCKIADADGNIIPKKKIMWQDGQTLVFFAPGETAQLEATYRAFDD
jgi:hypothetical protein